MAYVIVNTSTQCRIAHPRTGKSTWSTERAAKAAVTRIGKIKDCMGKFVAMDYDTYRAQVPMVEVKNLMSGKLVQIRADEVGGPCDPSTERYWTM